MTENLFTRTEGDDDLRALATIDPAGPRAPEAHRSETAQALLAEISGSPATTAEPVRTRRRWPWLAAAAAVAAGVVVLAPTVGSGGGAYASWTDVPAAATAADAAEAEQYCRDMWRDVLDDQEEDMPAVAVADSADLVIAEQRGDFTYTVLSDGDWGMDCLVETRTGFRWFGSGGGGAGGSLQPLGDSGDLAPDGIADLMLGGFGGQDIEGMVLMMYARVGADVSAAVVHTPGAGDVEATVTNGYLAAWAPGLPENALDEPSIGLTLYLTDGSEVELTPTELDTLSRANNGG